MQNQQAKEAGKKADEIIKQLANPSETIVTDKTEVEVLDKAVDVAHPSQVDVPTEQPAEAAPVPVDDYETRFKRYKASTDITIRDLRIEVEELRNAKNENEALKRRLDELSAQIPSTPSELLEHFSQEEADMFSKLVDGKVGGLQSEVERLNAELEAEKASKKEVAKVSTHQTIVEQIKHAVPNYSQIDVDPDFRTYIEGLDEYGNVRYDMLIRAKNSTPPDVGRIIQFYVDFDSMKNHAPVQEEPTKQYTQQELLQNPSSQSSASVETPQGRGIVWDQAHISQLYADKAKGKISPQEFRELEADMYASKGWKT